MTNKENYSYPDVLKHITSDTAQNISTLQIAMTTRPRVIRAGKPFEALILIQNTVNAPVDVALSLQLPEKDAQGKKDRFIAGKTHLVVGLQPAEVGYVSLPLSSLPDAAPGNDYQVNVNIQVKALEKGETIRDQNSGELDVQQLPETIQEEVEKLHTLHFVTKRQRTLRGNVLATNFILLPGKVGTPLRLEPAWHTLWSLEYQNNHELLLDKYRDLIRQNVLPKLRRRALYDPLREKTAEFFKTSGYPLTEIENIVITKMLVLILEYANASRTSHDVLEAGHYDLEGRMAEKREHIDESGTLPEWLVKYLRIISKDERFANVPAKAIPHFAYEELLMDAMYHTFHLIQNYTGDDLGPPDEMKQYARAITQKVQSGHKLTFEDVYMPLIIGGLIKFDQVMMPGEELGDYLEEIRVMLVERDGERTADNGPIFHLARFITDQSLKKYGALNNRW